MAVSTPDFPSSEGEMLLTSQIDDHHGYEEPKTFADYVRPEYWYR